MFGSVNKFLRNRKGAFAMQFALMVVPLTVCTGLAIDGGRAFLARFELESALDAAALAVGSTTYTGADLDGVARTFVNANFHSPHSGPIALTLTPGDDLVTLKGNVTINTYFMPLVGQDTVTVSAESEVRRGGGNVEVSLALDITQSMSGTKIAALKQAAKDLVDEVVNDKQTPYFSKVALAPWGTNFHAGAYADALRGTVTGPATITAATWRSGSAKTITGGNWKNGAAITSVSANWRTGTEFTVSTVAKISSPSHVRITVTGTPTALVNGDVVGLYLPTSGSANGSFASYKDKAYKLADRSGTTTVTFDLQDLNGAYIAPPSGTATNGTSWRVTECLNTACQMRLSNSGTNNLVNGDYVHLTGFSAPYAGLNHAAATGTSQVTSSPTAPTSTTAFINVVGPTLGNPNSTTGNATGGTIQECYTSTCEYAITAASHGFANGDQINISSTSTSGGGATDIDNTSGSWTWTIANVTTNTFTLPGAGTSYANWSSSGTASKCFTTTCEVQVTAAGHGLADNDYVAIASVAGMTGINNSGTSGPSSAWQVKSVSGNNFVLTNSTGPSYSAWTSGGSAQCLTEGCQKYRYKSNATGTTSAPYQYQIRTISNCVTERLGTNAATDVAPTTAYLGRDYAGAGSLVGCDTNNNLVPLSSDKATIKTKIENMETYGSTAGQIGAAWAWYMLSPNWGYLWPADTNRPKAYDYKHLAKVAVLMTDGEFNTAHCHGVTSESYHYSSVDSTDQIDTSICTPAKAPFAQAQDICTAMKAEGIIVYTVGFEVGSEPGAADFLTACATDTNHAYLANDANALKAAFKSIAKEITKLRISK